MYHHFRRADALAERRLGCSPLCDLLSESVHALKDRRGLGPEIETASHLEHLDSPLLDADFRKLCLGILKNPKGRFRVQRIRGQDLLRHRVVLPGLGVQVPLVHANLRELLERL